MKIRVSHHHNPAMADPLSRAVRFRPVRPSWIAAFLVAVALLAGAVLSGFGSFRASDWVPGEAHAAPRTLRASIAEGRQPGGGPTRIDYGRIDTRLQRLIGQDGMAGLAVAIVENGELRFVKGYGRTGADATDPVTANTVFRWASLSKGVAATMVAELADQKRLSLSDPVARWSPSLKLPGGSEHRVTVANLLSHRLGIVKNAYDDKLEEGIDPRLIRRMLAQLQPYCPPGTCHAYENVAYDAASEVVQNATHQSYGDALRERLFVPLGMLSASTTRLGLESAPSWARPHRGSRILTVTDAYYRIPAAGGVNSSIFDLGLWMRAQMGEMPGVLPMRVLDTIHMPRVATDRHGYTAADRQFTAQRYGLGWRDSVYDGHRIVFHRGAVDGYRSLIMFDPVLRSGVAMLWNSETSKPAPLGNEVLDMLYARPATDWLGLDKPQRRRG